MISGVIFDLDGTLLYTLENLHESTNYALNAYNCPPRTIEEIRSFVGNGVQKLMERAMPEGALNPDFEECLALFKEHYKKTMYEKTRPYDGVMEVLEELKKSGVKRAVVSNKFDSAVKELCERYFKGLVEIAVGEGGAIRKKPAPDGVFKVLEEFRRGAGEEESARADGESARVDEESARADEEIARADKEIGSVDEKLGAHNALISDDSERFVYDREKFARVDEEIARADEESARADGESARVDEESTSVDGESARADKEIGSVDEKLGAHNALISDDSERFVYDREKFAHIEEEIVYVGDSEVDIETAKNAGLKCISVSWGYKDEEFLRAHGAEIIARTPKELLNILLSV